MSSASTTDHEVLTTPSDELHAPEMTSPALIENNITITTTTTSTHKKANRFSLRGITRTLSVRKHVMKGFTKSKAGKLPTELKSARKSSDASKEGTRMLRKVSFTPSIEKATNAREAALQKHRATDYSQQQSTISGKVSRESLRRRASYGDSITRHQARTAARKRSVSFTSAHSIVHVNDDQVVYDPEAKSGPARPQVSKSQALAARHARALEQVINAGASINFDSVEGLKARREEKTGGNFDKSKVQMLAAISPRKVLALKKALLDSDMANDIIGELKYMKLDAKAVTPPGSSFQQANAADLLSDVLASSSTTQRVPVKPAPLKAVCLDCTEVEAEDRNRQVELEMQAEMQSGDKDSGDKAVITNAAGFSMASLVGLGGFFAPSKKTVETVTITDRQGHQLTRITETTVSTPASEAMQFSEDIREDLADGHIAEAAADLTRLSVLGLKEVQPLAGAVAERLENQVLPVKVHLDKKRSGSLQGVSPISLILSPISSAATFGGAGSGAYDALGDLSGVVVRAANGSAMDTVHPPTDRMAIFVHWWGFELTLPRSSMTYLSTAQNISSSFLTFLQTMVTTGGVPELLPFIRYFSTFMDMEFGAIKSQDRGHGVVVAATWLMPMALVPRPWDYPLPLPSPPHSANKPDTPLSKTSFASFSSQSQKSVAIETV